MFDVYNVVSDTESIAVGMIWLFVFLSFPLYQLFVCVCKGDTDVECSQHCD